jgi:hypothetical protein
LFPILINAAVVLGFKERGEGKEVEGILMSD